MLKGFVSAGEDWACMQDRQLTRLLVITCYQIRTHDLHHPGFGVKPLDHTRISADRQHKLISTYFERLV